MAGSGIDALIEIIQAWAENAYPGRLPTVIEVHFHSGEKLKIPMPTTAPVMIEQSPKPLSECERDILKLLEQAEQRMKQSEICAALSDREEEPWGESTVRNALASLIKQKLLVNDYDGRGYGLSGW